MRAPVDLPGFSRRAAPKWRSPGGLSWVLSQWEGDPRLWKNVTLDRRLGPALPRCCALPEQVPAELRGALARRGIESLYVHQAEAYRLARSGTDVVVATPTASGKSLCYNLPVLDHLARDPTARALYLFPTKALSRDQEHALVALMQDAGLCYGAVTYDGDTPPDARRAARQRGAVILTNPDMLHSGILPHHTSWATFFAGLRYVVIDELHSYRGVFGSHLANVLRRLQRIARFHGSTPVFLMSSATIGNPGEHAERVIGRPPGVITTSGAPVGPRRVLVYNPPVTNAALGIRASYLKTAVRLTGDLVAGGVSTLVFGQSRNGVETMLKYLRDRIEREGHDPESVYAYRGGYLPQTRREIERRLREGAIRCVVATNALELGIDIGALDAVVCAGYPGTLAALWQRFGRAGRRTEASLALLVTSSTPLDQYVARAAAAFVESPVEQARIDPDNVEILVQHIKCAAFELPFDQGEPFGRFAADSTAEVLGYLHRLGVVHESSVNGRVRHHWASDAYPANHVSLRSASWDNFAIIDVERAETLAEMDWRSCHTMLHEQAIYQHAAVQYQVERLDYDNHKAFVRRVEPDYYTTAMTHTKIQVLDCNARGPVGLAHGNSGALVAGWGEVSVVEKVVGYKKIKFHTHENVGYGDVHLPEIQMHTTAWWLVFDEALVRAQPQPRAIIVDAIGGIASALHTVAAAGLMTDPRDLGCTLGDRRNMLVEGGDAESEDVRADDDGPATDPMIVLYDHVAGGIGLAERLFEERDTLLRRSRALIEGCPCDEGCPGCIGPCGSGLDGGPVDRPLLKKVAVAMLEAAGIEALH